MRKLVEEVRGPYRMPAAVACLILAAIYVAVWPSEQADGLATAHRFMLRWAHPVVWVVLRLACLLFGTRASAGRVRRVAAIGGLLDIAFFLAVALA